MTDITELAKAAEKYRLTLEAHRNNPRDGVVLDAWDDATSKFMELVDNDEFNIISGLVEALEIKEEQRANWFQMAQKLGEDLDAAEKRNSELVEALEKAQQYSKERDAENQDLMLTVGRLRVEREELESRTVKLPEAFYPDGDIDCPLAVNVDDVKDVLTAAGIKWEAE